MLRLTLLLLAGMSAALFTLGEDKGQLRPGLAVAKAEGRLDEVWAEARAKAVRVSAPAPMVTPVIAPETSPVLVAVAEPAPVAQDLPVVTVPEAAVEVEPGRDIVAMVEEPVFSLQNYGNEAVPGEDGTSVGTAAAPEAVAGGEGTIWYVNASSVNVRAAPSTGADVLGKLGSGEAALMVAAVDDEWARIVIQGDGMEGYVAIRFLSPSAP